MAPGARPSLERGVSEGARQRVRSARLGVLASGRCQHRHKSRGVLGTGMALVVFAQRRACSPRAGIDALELARAPVRAAMAAYFHAAGFVRKLVGDLTGAREHYEKSLSLYRSAGSERDAAQLCGNLADTNWALGALDAAATGFREAIALMRGSNKGTTLMLGVNLTNLAGVL